MIHALYCSGDLVSEGTFFWFFFIEKETKTLLAK
jgi:hypothetical protein